MWFAYSHYIRRRLLGWSTLLIVVRLGLAVDSLVSVARLAGCLPSLLPFSVHLVAQLLSCRSVVLVYVPYNAHSLAGRVGVSCLSRHNTAVYTKCSLPLHYCSVCQRYYPMMIALQHSSTAANNDTLIYGAIYCRLGPVAISHLPAFICSCFTAA